MTLVVDSYPVLNAPLMQKDAIRQPGRSEARATAALMLAGAGFVGLSLVLPHPSGGHVVALSATAVGMGMTGLVVWFLASRLPPAAVARPARRHGSRHRRADLGVWVAVGQYGTIFTWATLISAYFYSRRSAAIHLAWLLLVYARLARRRRKHGRLLAGDPLALCLRLADRGDALRQQPGRSPRPGRHPRPSLLRPLPGHALHDGYAGALHRGQRRLAAQPRLPAGGAARPPPARADPPRRPRPRHRGGLAGLPRRRPQSLETRVRAKDGSWHWLRTSSVFEPLEGLVYARSTDVTERKANQEERERLMREVELLARSDALTGLPNRRALDDQLPREMARALRMATPLCLAIIDIDHFKTYNDTYGHLAGDAVLRGCAAAWDAELRGEDMILRFGGEEFLAILPNCAPADATEIIERLRAAMPEGQTCSAGLATWVPGETVDELVARADKALYEAKESGRNRLIAAA